MRKINRQICQTYRKSIDEQYFCFSGKVCGLGKDSLRKIRNACNETLLFCSETAILNEKKVYKNAPEKKLLTS